MPTKEQKKSARTIFFCFFYVFCILYVCVCSFCFFMLSEATFDFDLKNRLKILYVLCGLRHALSPLSNKGLAGAVVHKSRFIQNNQK